jgi:GAF domain-containing protein
VDCFDALTSDRPYRRRMTDAAAVEILLERRGRMYDPSVVDAFIRVYRDIDVGAAETTEQRDVLQRITQARADAPAPLERVTVAVAEAESAPSSLLAFVSLARVAGGEATVGDVVALGSRLMSGIAPRASGAWFVPTPAGDGVVAIDAFGPAAPALRGVTIAVGERLTGWVAANRLPIANSPANLDLASRVDLVDPPLVSCASVPLLVGDALAAVLSIYSPDGNALSDDLGRLLQMIAPHLASAIDSASSGAPIVDVRPPDKNAGGALRLVSTR